MPHDKLHDRKTFKRSEKVLSEKQFYKMYRRLNGSAECRMSELHRLDDIQKFFAKAGCSFLHPAIDAARQDLMHNIAMLKDFLSIDHFDKWPYAQEKSDFIIQLRPELLRDTGHRNVQDGDREKWEKLFASLKDKLQCTVDSYGRFRMLVKQHLHA